MRKFAYFAIAVLGLLAPGLLSVIPASAAQTLAKPASGITVAPAFLNADLLAGSTQTTVAVGVRNNFSVPITLEVSLSRLKLQNNTLTPTKYIGQPSQSFCGIDITTSRRIVTGTVDQCASESCRFDTLIAGRSLRRGAHQAN